MALTPKRRRFIAEYLKDLNATKAAIRAGYSAKNADVVGPRLLGKVSVKREVDAALERRAVRTEVKQDDVLRELLAMADVDPSRAVDPVTGKLLPLHEMPADVRRSIASVEVFEEWGGRGDERAKVGEVIKVKFWPKDKALELLGKHLKMFTDKVQHEGGVAISIVDPFAAPKEPAK